MSSFLNVFSWSCYCRYVCSYCKASVGVFGRHGLARIHTMYGFNTVVVVDLLQVVVPMNEDLPFDSIFCSLGYFIIL